MQNIEFRLETVHMDRLVASGNFQRAAHLRIRNVEYNTLAKVVRAALEYFLSLDETDQECPRQMRLRKVWVPSNPAHPISSPAKRFHVELPTEQHRALKHIKVIGYWPNLQEIILTALDLWLPLNFAFGAEEEWMREHDPSRDSWYERPRPYPPEGIFRTVEEHNQWRNRVHPKPRPKRRVYKQRKKKEETP